MSSTEKPTKLLEELGLQGDTSEAVQQGLEVAAALGSPVDMSEWREACAVVGAQESAQVVEELGERGWVVIDQEKWSFEGDDLRDALIDAARDAGRWKSHQAACAQMLFELHSAPADKIAQRRVEHLREAGKTHELLVSLLDAEKEAFDAGDFEVCTDYLDQRNHLLDVLEAPEDDPRRAQNEWRRARLLNILGQPNKAKTLVERSIQLLRDTDWASDRAQAALLYGRMLRDDGDFDAALSHFSAAIDHFATAGDEHGLATSRASRAYVDLQRGDYAVAREQFSTALEVFDELDDTFMTASLLIFIAHTWIFGGEPNRGAECVRRAGEIARQAGHLPNEAGAWNTLGEIAREAGDWSEARRAYQSAIKAFDAYGSRSGYIARYNLALVEIGDGRFERALDLLEGLEQSYIAAGLGARVALIYTGLMTCAAGQGDWELWDHYHELATQRLEEADTAHNDIVWMAERAAQMAAEHQNGAAEARALALVDAQRTRLDQSDDDG